VVVVGAPLRNLSNVIVPGRLFHQLADHERFEKMAELGGRGRIEPGKFRRSEAKHVRGESGVDEIELGRLGDPETEAFAPMPAAAVTKKRSVNSCV
jgi:hypothetical protein